MKLKETREDWARWKRALRRKGASKCSKCGTTGKINRHHVNGSERTLNLCTKCHMAIHSKRGDYKASEVYAMADKKVGMLKSIGKAMIGSGAVGGGYRRSINAEENIRKINEKLKMIKEHIPVDPKRQETVNNMIMSRIQYARPNRSRKRKLY